MKRVEVSLVGRLVSYHTDSIPCGKETCASTTAHACMSPQPTVSSVRTASRATHHHCKCHASVCRRLCGIKAPTVMRSGDASSVPPDRLKSIETLQPPTGGRSLASARFTIPIVRPVARKRVFSPLHVRIRYPDQRLAHVHSLWACRC